jgi:hypothetical protein
MSAMNHSRGRLRSNRGIVTPRRKRRYAKRIGRIGALALALGIGSAVGAAATAHADDAKTHSSDQRRSSSAPRTASTSAARTPRPITATNQSISGTGSLSAPVTPKTPSVPAETPLLLSLSTATRRELESTQGGTGAAIAPAMTARKVRIAASADATTTAVTQPANVLIEGESMSVTPRTAASVYNDSAASGKKALLLSTNATASRTVMFPDSTSLVIRAWGDQYRDAPTMTVSVDGKLVATVSVSATKWTDYTVPVTIAAGTHTVSVAFTNDLRRSTSKDRNLRIDSITAVAAVVDPNPSQPPYFQNADWLWKPIVSNPVLAANSATWVNYLSDPKGQRIADLYDYGVTLIPGSAIDSSTPRYDVTFTEPWGSDPLGTHTVPIPAGTTVAPGSDGHLTVLDPTTGKAYGLWQAKYDSSTNSWSASWGGITDLNGNGVDQSGSATGSAIARYAGVITASEFSRAIAANTGLDHALFISTDIAGSAFTSPAAKSDGSNIAGVAVPIPEGTRIQLDPSINVDAIAGISPAEKVIAKTLQTYGAYVGDQGGARMAFIFEEVPGASSDNPATVWRSAGLAWDYYDMTSIPWSQLRVLDSWDGTVAG